MIEAHELTKKFHQHEVDVSALHGVSFNLEEGDTLAICGRSGAGKSTLLNLLGGLDKPTSGQVKIHDENITELTEKREANFRNQNLGFIFQFHHLLQDFNILENVMMPLLIQSVRKKQAKLEAKNILQKVGLQGLESRYPKELSGGEQQRAAIARALIHKPKIILADEPTGNLDEKNADSVFELLCSLNRDLGSTLIVVTHNLNFANKLNHILTLEAGQIQSFE